MSLYLCLCCALKIRSTDLQAALPALLFTGGTEADSASLPSTLQLYGGTDAEFAPPVGYMQKILLPTLRRLWGLDIADQVNNTFSQRSQ